MNEILLGLMNFPSLDIIHNPPGPEKEQWLIGKYLYDEQQPPPRTP